MHGRAPLMLPRAEQPYNLVSELTRPEPRLPHGLWVPAEPVEGTGAVDSLRHSAATPNTKRPPRRRLRHGKEGRPG
jgi:hypothetical protein